MKVVISTNNKDYVNQILEKFAIHFSNKQCKKITINNENTTVVIEATSYFANRTVGILKNFVAHNFNNEVSIELVEK
jgi:hypothetical protein